MGPTLDNLVVREATHADALTLAKFNLALARETEDRALNPSLVESGVLRGLAHPDLCRYFVAERDDATIGQAMVTSELSDWRDGIFWWFQSVYVDASHRGRGVFKAIFRHVESLAREESDVCGLRLYVHRDNRDAIEVYARLGMTESEYVVCESDWVLET